MEQINTLFKEVAEIKAIINKEEPTEPVEEYPSAWEEVEE